MSAEDLRRKISGRIRAEGPLTIAAYMALALHDPEDGYYAEHHPIGAAGDFVTAPEISQIFGELIGLWCASVWREAGSPDPIAVAELGPGRGTLMCDFLRAAAVMLPFRRALRLYLLEASPVLRREQERRLGHARPTWVASIDQLPAGPLLLVANEFLDALPIRQFVRGEKHWAERLVGLDHHDNLVFVAGPENAFADRMAATRCPDGARKGEVVEVCPAALALATALGRRFAHTSGAALFVDYGYFPARRGASLRGVQGHHPVPALASPGAVDLSAHVDFAAFIDAARVAGAAVYGPATQSRFLRDLGVAARLGALQRRAGQAQGEALAAAVERLLDPEQMGTLFKAAALVSPGLPSPTGFESAARWG